MMDWNLTLRTALLMLAAALSVCLLFSQLVNIYFGAKLNYMSRLIGGLGKALTDAAETIEKKMKNPERRNDHE